MIIFSIIGIIVVTTILLLIAMTIWYHFTMPPLYLNKKDYNIVRKFFMAIKRKLERM